MKPRGPLTMLARSRIFRWSIAILIGLQGLYLASTGPVVWLHERGFLTESHEPLIDAFYRPLEWYPKVVVQALDKYQDLWR